MSSSLLRGDCESDTSMNCVRQEAKDYWLATLETGRGRLSIAASNFRNGKDFAGGYQEHKRHCAYTCMMLAC